jgi:microcystin-dependent protein
MASDDALAVVSVQLGETFGVHNNSNNVTLTSVSLLDAIDGYQIDPDAAVAVGSLDLSSAVETGNAEIDGHLIVDRDELGEGGGTYLASGVRWGATGDVGIWRPSAGNLQTDGVLTADKFVGSGVVPIGAMLMWGTTTAPADWVLCDGSSLLRAGTYADLFAVIGTTYGSIDGTHFNVPDLRQRVPLGKAASGTGNTLGGTGGSIDHAHTLSDHSHSFTQPSAHVLGDTGGNNVAGVARGTAAPTATTSAASHTHGPSSITNNHSGGAVGSPSTDATDSDNMPYLVVNFIIRYA